MGGSVRMGVRGRGHGGGGRGHVRGFGWAQVADNNSGERRSE